MPVKLTFDDTPPAAPQPAGTPAPGPGATDALLDNPPPPAPPAAPSGTIATAHVGHTDKGGNVVHADTEHVKLSNLPAPAPGYTGMFNRVTYGMGATVNTGNFENMRPFVQLEVMCTPDQRDAAYNEAFDWVDARITSLVLAAKQANKGA